MRKLLDVQGGYALIDNRASGGTLQEFGYNKCAHCQKIVPKNPGREQERATCWKCHRYICDNPVCHFECIPFDQVVEEIVNAAQAGRRPRVPERFRG